MVSPRTGRPKVENPITKRFSVCFDEETLKQLDAYCEKHSISRSTAIRKGIHLLLAQK